MKQNYVSMTNTIDDNNVKSLGTENKLLNSIWIWCQNNTRLILFIGAKSKFPQILTLDTYGLISKKI